MSNDLKKDHPQKYYLKLICSSLFYVGLGTYWYERNKLKHPNVYKIWVLVINGYTIFVILNQILAILRTDLSPDEKSELVQYGLGPILVVVKYVIMYKQRNRISNVLEILLEKNRDVFKCPALDRSSIKKAKIFCYPYITGLLTALTMLTVNGIRAAINGGGSFQIVPSYYPAPTSSGIFTQIVRLLLLFHYWLIVGLMILSECLCFCCLIFVTYKFSHVKLYFKSRRKRFLENKKWKTQLECEDEFENDIVLGIKMHEDALWCARNVQRALGLLYGIQILECILLLAVAMLGLVNAGRNLVEISVNMIFIGCLSFLTACYMIPAGDITYEAAQIPTAIFHSGWERVRARRRLRALLVVAIMRAQRPVHMTAFGVLDLSYESFILVLRTSYSFFALMHQRGPTLDTKH